MHAQKTAALTELAKVTEPQYYVACLQIMVDKMLLDRDEFFQALELVKYVKTS